MNITFQIDYTGTPDEEDIRAATFAIDKTNEALAAADPPGTPWPKSTNVELKASYLSILEAKGQLTHASYEKQSSQIDLESAKISWDNATDAQRAAALSALTA